MKPRAYIAAPFWHPSPLIREWNTARAELLARLAAAEGFDPVFVHRELMRLGVDDDAFPKARETGLARTCATVREIAEEGGRMYVLTLPGTVRGLTDGCRAEFSAWLSVRTGDVLWLTWKRYRSHMKRAGLLAEWAALAAVPG